MAIAVSHGRQATTGGTSGPLAPGKPKDLPMGVLASALAILLTQRGSLYQATWFDTEDRIQV